MSHPKQADLGALLEALTSAGVELIIIGGAAAVLHGAPTTTLDLDIVYRRTPENLARLLAMLERLDAWVRDPARREIRPQLSHLEAAGQLRLTTSLGPMDLMGRLEDGRGYEDLLPHSAQVSGGNLQLRVLDLPTLIAVKSGAGRAKDRLLLPVLLALLEKKGDGA